MSRDFDYERMLAGELYCAPDISPKNSSMQGKKLVQQINQLPIDKVDEIIDLEKKLFGKTGETVYVHPPLYVDYGRHTEVGNNFYANMDCVFLDVNKIIIGNNVMLGPRVCLYTAGHPTDAEIRNKELEFGLSITIEDNVWIGGSALILPGVTVGKNSIVAAGSVVTKDVPRDTLVGGNPAKIIRTLGELDRKKWSIEEKKYFEAKNKVL
ncbi:sugar O-acetyltransferase [Enterococcus xiangfangensis]|uniref:Acetyltransferase n=1 Tax=Enterococcus xiangfangensis TaxID=1296537 RepID=A0ABU3F672_9ENTE|nr:sugar O-acetyltransferase [Enterococcus xiangfangensis]MDT2758174.1 sugar O-acetyltransferase [Enterococcus xiangfangensis]